MSEIQDLTLRRHSSSVYSYYEQTKLVVALGESFSSFEDALILFEVFCAPELALGLQDSIDYYYSKLPPLSRDHFIAETHWIPETFTVTREHLTFIYAIFEDTFEPEEKAIDSFLLWHTKVCTNPNPVELLKLYTPWTFARPGLISAEVSPPKANRIPVLRATDEVASRMLLKNYKDPCAWHLYYEQVRSLSPLVKNDDPVYHHFLEKFYASKDLRELVAEHPLEAIEKELDQPERLGLDAAAYGYSLKTKLKGSLDELVPRALAAAGGLLSLLKDELTKAEANYISRTLISNPVTEAQLIFFEALATEAAKAETLQDRIAVIKALGDWRFYVADGGEKGYPLFLLTQTAATPQELLFTLKELRGIQGELSCESLREYCRNFDLYKTMPTSWWLPLVRS